MKRIITLSVVCFILIALAACGSSSEQQEGTTNNKEDFENYAQYIGQPLESIGSGFEEKNSSGEFITYDTHIASTWNNNDGTIWTTVNSSETILAVILKFDSDELSDDAFESAKEYLTEKYGEGKEITSGMIDYYYDDYKFRITRDRYIISWDEEHVFKDKDTENQQTETTEITNQSNSDSWDLFVSLLGKDFSELPDYYDMTYADIGTATADYKEHGMVSVFRDSDTKKINVVSYQPKANDPGFIEETEVAAWVKMLSDDYGKAEKTTMDNSSKQHQGEDDIYRCDHYVIYDGDKMLAQVLAEKEDGTNINDVSIVFYDNIIKR